jgi:peptide/nickel transport system substrate-binding protein
LSNKYVSVSLSALLAIFVLAACALETVSPTQSPLPPVGTELPTQPPSPTSHPSDTPTPLPEPPRLLTICLGREPLSLFLYDANSLSAQSVLAAIYDGPFDVQNFTSQPVIVEKIPSLADGDALLQPVEVKPGDLMVDATGNLVVLGEGIVYRPSGCMQTSCAQTYSGDQPVQIDQWSMRFRLKAGLQWSDGAALTADDSLYSFEVAQALYPAALPDLVGRTAAYHVLDELTIEWVGVPGYQDGLYAPKFFSPLPRHAWGILATQDLPTLDTAYRTPLGWGPYVIDEWVAGDHITLHKNERYWRTAEGLPRFDNLVYRFMADGDEALQALLAGECDFIDQTVLLEEQSQRLSDLQSAGKIQALFKPGTAWELISFGINSLEDGRLNYFALKEVRQAFAFCIDRQTLVNSLSQEGFGVADLYVPSSHPLYNPDATRYDYDPQRAGELLASVGWLDVDGDPATPRIAQGVQGVPDGTAFEVDYLVSPDEERQAVAQQIQDWLAGCGIKINLVTQPFVEYLASGPEGLVFGRKFDLAQLAWATSSEPPCYLYLTSEIPGPYPEFSRGWGGVNAAGYSNPQYDWACQDALFSIPDAPQHVEAHKAAQAIFAEDSPALPLYWYFKALASRPDLCGLAFDPTALTALQSIETVDYGLACK